ncbi:MAG TPA: D-aminoacyl-tRNA deacylase [bacterium]|nr:D-aminoacyl-tRNA deacylase [bacterium]HQP99978.1 D-aminoacyl-tRNA deacylase [bacterium]
MRAVIQRVSHARVTVDGEVVGAIGAGVLVLLGVRKGDTERDLFWLVDKICELRMFRDEDGKMNRSLLDIAGEVLVVSQFTLCADCRKGRRPGFDQAADPAEAERFYEQAVMRFRERGLKTESGRFGAIMQVDLRNDGPVTFVIESPGSKQLGAKCGE